MLATMCEPKTVQIQSPYADPSARVMAMLNSIMTLQEETLKRVVRLETRTVNLMLAHNLDRDGCPLR